MLKKQVKKLCAVSKEQARAIVSLKTGKHEKSRGSSCKNWSEYCPSHRSVKRKQLVTGIYKPHYLLVMNILSRFQWTSKISGKNG